MISPLESRDFNTSFEEAHLYLCMISLQVESEAVPGHFVDQPNIVLGEDGAEERVNNLLGRSVVSGNVLNDIDGQMGLFFVFHDVGVIRPGRYRLLCRLIQVRLEQFI